MAKPAGSMELDKTRLIFVKGADDHGRDAKMRALIGKAASQLIRRRFAGISDLNASLYASLVEHLERLGHLRTRPFDAAACPVMPLWPTSRTAIPAPGGRRASQGAGPTQSV